MKILQICNKSPFPPIEGGPIAMNAITQGLFNLGCEVKVLAMNTFKYFVDPKEIPNIYKEKTNIELVFIDLSIKPIDAFFNLFTNKSYHVERFISKEFNSKLIEILKKEKFDIVQLETIFIGPYIDTIRKYSDAKIVLRAHNIEHHIWERIARITNNSIKKLYFKHLSKTLKEYELSLLNKFDGVAAITKGDSNFFQKTEYNIPIHCIPFGIDPLEYEGLHVANNKISLFHIGAMNWIPNQEGISWFLEKVWPEVNNTFPDLEFFLAGRKMPQWLLESTNPNVKVLGEVPDAKEFIKLKSIMIVPLFSGSGIRIKIIEGMAAGKTIISTSVGAEGINYTDGKDILIADTPMDFISQIKKCKKNPDLCKEIGYNARCLVEKEHNMSKNSKQLVDFYLSLNKQII